MLDHSFNSDTPFFDLIDNMPEILQNLGTGVFESAQTKSTCSTPFDFLHPPALDDFYAVFTDGMRYAVAPL